MASRNADAGRLQANGDRVSVRRGVDLAHQAPQLSDVFKAASLDRERGLIRRRVGVGELLRRYSDVEFAPGPRLNVVMGPNGTGAFSWEVKQTRVFLLGLLPF